MHEEVLAELAKRREIQRFFFPLRPLRLCGSSSVSKKRKVQKKNEKREMRSGKREKIKDKRKEGEISWLFSFFFSNFTFAWLFSFLFPNFSFVRVFYSRCRL